MDAAPVSRCGGRAPDRCIPETVNVKNVCVAQLRGDDAAERRRIEDGPWPRALAVMDGNALVFPARDDRIGQFGIAIGRRRDDPDVNARLALGAAQAQDTARRPAIDEGRSEIGADVNDAKTHSARRVDDVIRQA